MKNNESAAELIHVAKAMVRGELGLIEGARLIGKLRYSTSDPDDDVFLGIIGFEAETDEFIIGAARKLYSPEYLSKIDGRMSDYIHREGAGVIQDCLAIIERFS